jgi:hypothetical protein
MRVQLCKDLKHLIYYSWGKLVDLQLYVTLVQATVRPVVLELVPRTFAPAPALLPS